ncbi:MAG: pyridoxal phosphate-dependent aminotransferase [Muribaculaceae bacterium]|nr:pyridoxal phosphate-dependent aminotransferase [Muribaculaceae bacterium]
MGYSFDRPVDRRGSGSYKWDSADDTRVLPLWVADMDFQTAPVVIEALRRRVDHGVFGYTLVDDGYYDALTKWFRRRHGYEIARDRVIYTSGVVPALSAIIKALAAEGDGVIVQTPVYNCFFSSIRNNGCRIVENPLKRVDFSDGTFSYEMDFDDLEAKVRETGVKLMLLCNPHNPAGRLWNRAELTRVAEICRRAGVRVVSDEIHCELTRPGSDYVAYGIIDREVNGDAPQGVVCLSPSKAFNTAGLQIANIVCPDKEVMAKIDRAININEVCDVNPFGVEGLKAAYSAEGEEWLGALREYLWGNYDFFASFMREQLPMCGFTRLEATYLPWIDVSFTGIPSEELEERLKQEAKVWVNCGEMYGKDGFIRINLACRRCVLAEGLARIAEWINKHRAV